MSQGANKDFLANPTKWLRQNVLICDVNSNISVGTNRDNPLLGNVRNRFEAGALIECNLEKSLDQGKFPGGAKVPVWKLKAPTTGGGHWSHRFNAYYLPYRPNTVRTMVLDPAQFPPGADFFFTDTINGCTVTAGPGATPKVGHFNRTEGGQDGASIDQAEIDRDVGNEFGGGTVVKLTKTTYKPGVGAAATFIGIRNGTTWNFFWQGPRDLAGYTKRDKLGNSGMVWDLPANMLNTADNFG